MSEVMLEVKGVSKLFSVGGNKASSLKEFIGGVFHQHSSQEFFALKDVNFTLFEGEALGIIGKNGAGKSTLLKILSGISPPSTGEVNFYGKVVSILEVGAGFHPELTGRENIYLAGALYGFSHAEMRVRYQQIVDFSDIGAFISEPVKNYSSGMYLRLAFSIITCLDADIYLIDEVINVGDANFQNKCKGRMEELIAAGKTMIIASHNLNEIISLCNRIILMEGGEIVKEGGMEVIQQYMTRALPQYFSFEDGVCFHVTDVRDTLKHIDGITIDECGIEQLQQLKNGINVDYPFTIFFEVTVKVKTAYVLRLKIYDSTGVLVFVCSTLNFCEKMREPGRYRIEFIMPPYLFNRRMYWADISVINYDKHTILGNVDKYIAFKMAEDILTHTSEESNYLPGIVKPKIEVQLKAI
jgi:lipopolysaccharide transport system ATP-binding protein